MHLVSQEGESFDIKVSVAKMSNLVKTMIDGEMTMIVGEILIEEKHLRSFNFLAWRHCCEAWIGSDEQLHENGQMLHTSVLIGVSSVC